VEELLFSVVTGDGNALLIVTHDSGIARNARTRYRLTGGVLKSET
jgi:predicted ABC-type transport system involved in lysophospholipase L1 biosynthesis ATPase subunit